MLIPKTKAGSMAGAGTVIRSELFVESRLLGSCRMTSSLAPIRLIRKYCPLHSGSMSRTSSALSVVPVVDTCRSKSTTAALMHSGRDATPEPNSISGMKIELAAKTTPKAKPVLPTKVTIEPRLDRGFNLGLSR